MQSSVAAIRGGRIRPRYVHPSSQQRVRRLGLAHVASVRMVTAPRPSDAGRPCVGGLDARTGRLPAASRPVRNAPLRRGPRMTWTHPFVSPGRRVVVDPAAPWRD